MSQAIVESAINYLEFCATHSRGGISFTDPEVSKKYFRLRLDLCRDREHFDVAFLNSRHQLIQVERLFSGTIDGSEVSPRIIIQRALACNAAAIIVAHNHPSGSLVFSSPDKVLTNRIKQICELVDIRLLDHVLVGCGEGAVSAADMGWL